jgi:hypothetical protein
MKARWLSALYPRRWRERYGAEFEALLEEHGISPLTLLDVAMSALVAHLNPDAFSGGALLMIAKLRRSEITVLCAYVAFVVAGLAFAKLTEDAEFVAAAGAHAGVGTAFQVVLIGACLSLAAALAGALPIGLAVVRGALARRRRDVLGLLSVPPLALAVWVAFSVVPFRWLVQVVGPRPIHDPVNPLLAMTWMGLFVLAVVASATAVSLAVARSEVGPGALKWALTPGLALTAIMAVVWVAVLAWGVNLRADVPELFNGDDGMLATWLPLSWLAIAAVMAGAAAVATRSAIAGLRTARGTSPGD